MTCRAGEVYVWLGGELGIRKTGRQRASPFFGIRCILVFLKFWFLDLDVYQRKKVPMLNISTSQWASLCHLWLM